MKRSATYNPAPNGLVRAPWSGWKHIPREHTGSRKRGRPSSGRDAAPSLSNCVTVHLARMARRVAFAALATAFFARIARRVAFAALATAFFARMAFIAARIAFAMVWGNREEKLRVRIRWRA